jgi:Ran GTPase-activating protein (RanGAP) involved in mRNA processing and transport
MNSLAMADVCTILHPTPAFGPKRTAVTDLNLSGCWLGAEGTRVLMDSLKSGKSHIRRLDLSRNRIGPLGAQHVAWLVGFNIGKVPLQTLILANNDIGPQGLQAFTAGLVRNACPLKCLDLSMNKLCGVDEYGDGIYTHKELLKSMETITGNPHKLQELDISLNNTRKLTVDNLEVLVSRAPQLHVTRLPRCTPSIDQLAKR